MVRSRIGPMALESPLGPRGSTLYRAVHLQQKTQVALRLVSVPLGLTPEAKKQFAEELELLKKLKHPHLVRCLGGGFEGSDAYLVYELIPGESLQARVARQGRLPWELVLQYGLQLCDAVQTSHNAGLIHLRITPGQVLCPDDQSIKLAGAVGPLVRRLTHRPPTTEQLAFQPPEQLAAAAEPHPAMDLYALGAVMYHSLTGQPPLSADTPEELRRKIAADDPPPVATVVFDCPVWLSKIVEQLLHKDPLKRPFTAAAVSLALLEAQKRAASGASTLEHAVSGFSPLQMDLDREEAERALGVRPKKKPKARGREVSFFERPLVLFAMILLCVAGIYLATRPLSEDAMRRRAEKLLATGDLAYMYEARDKYLAPMLARYPDGEHRGWAEGQLEQVAMAKARRQMENNIRYNRDPDSEGERRMVEARRYERFGDRATALEKYRAIAELYGEVPEERPYANLAGREAARLEAEAPEAGDLRAFLTAKLDEADALMAAGDVAAASRIWESVLSLYSGNAEMVDVVSRAQVAADRMRAGAQAPRGGGRRPAP